VETCYRHPGRETGVSCSSCGRPICPDCMTPTPVGMRCPECSRQKTRVTTAQTFMRGATPVVTYALIAINVVALIAEIVTNKGTANAFTGVPNSSLVADGALSRGTVDGGDWWRLVTSGFLHAGVLHLLFNMFMLYILGTMLEPAIGRVRFVLIYLVSLLAGSFGALLAQPHGLSLGASGAVFGLAGAAFVVLRHRGIDPMQSGLGFFILFNLLLSFRPGISVGAHIGGLIGGALAAWVMYYAPQRVRMPEVVPLLLSVAIAAAAVVGAIAVSGSAT
jgi:membrane associated rhomboid family serine protease